MSGRRLRRRRSADAGGAAGHGGSDAGRWLVSYADFITLLFAFFVVMYSISQVNESKYRVLSNTLSESFSQTVNLDQADRRLRQATGQIVVVPPIVAQPQGDEPDETEQMDASITTDLNAVAEQFRTVYEQLISQDLAKVVRTDDTLSIEISNDVLFVGTTAKPDQQAQSLLFDTARILKKSHGSVVVESYTDDTPAASGQYPSNWELSAARAAAVVSILDEQGVNPRRLSATGFGEYHGKAGNFTEARRMRNRRTVIVMQRQTAATNGGGAS